MLGFGGPYDSGFFNWNFTTNSTQETQDMFTTVINRTLEQDVIMKVAKLSDFNIMLQSRWLVDTPVQETCAYCKICHAREILNSEQLFRYQNEEFWEKLGKFCEIHKHKPIIPVVENSGRVFRNE